MIRSLAQMAGHIESLPARKALRFAERVQRKNITINVKSKSAAAAPEYVNIVINLRVRARFSSAIAWGSKFNSSISRKSFGPMAVEGKPGEDQQQPNRRPNGALDEEIEGQRESSRDKNRRHYWISPGTIRPRQVRFFAA